MESLNRLDVRALLTFLEGLYAAGSPDGFARYVSETLPELVASEHTSYVDINFRTRDVRRVSQPSGPGFPGADKLFETLMHENPVLAYQQRTGDGRPRRISDFLTQQQFHRTRLYNEFHRRLRGEYQMILGLTCRRTNSIAIGLNRMRPDFSTRELLLASVVRPHLRQAYRTAAALEHLQWTAAALHSGLAATNAGLMAFGPTGRVKLITPYAARCLGKYFPKSGGRLGRVARKLWIQVRAREGGLARPSELPSPKVPFVVEAEATRLVIRSISCGADQVLLLEERPELPGPKALERLGLTGRESEVLSWVGRGKTNAETGLILGIAPRTVTKHLEHIFRKLGVETRTAAVAAMRDILHDQAD